MAKKPLVIADSKAAQITSADVLDIPGALQQGGIAAPDVAPLGTGVIYFDATAKTFQVSQNGSAYQDLLGGGGGGVPTTRQVIAGTGLTGGGALSSDVTLSMQSVGTAGTYGSASSVPVLTTNAQGQVSSVVNTSIQVAESQVTNLVSDLSSKVATTRQVIAGTGLTGGGALSSDVTLSMPNVGTAGTYGSAALIPSFTTDDQGRITSVTNNTPQFSTFAYLASSTQNITASSNQIIATTSFIVLSNTSGGTITLTSSPVINCPMPCVSGQVLLVFNSRASTNTITIPRGVTSGIALGTASRQLTPGAVLSLVFDGTYWIETAFATATL